MFSLFKKKPRDGELQGDLRRAVNDLRSEIGDNAVSKGMALNARVSRLKSVNLEFIQTMLELTDEVTDRIREQFQGYGALNVLEVDAFSASIVATAVLTIDIADTEALEVVDIYLGLWCDTAIKNHSGVHEATLKVQMDSLWLEYSKLILKAYGESRQEMMMNEDSPSRILVRNVDRLARVTREDGKEAVAAITLKTTISETIRILGISVR